MNIIKQYLNKPYPFEDSIGKRLFVSVLFGLFIGLFLLIFEPFDIHSLQHPNRSLFIFGFGFVTFISMLLTYLVLPALFRKFYNPDNWKVGKEIVHITLTIIVITFLNILYSLTFCEYCKPFYGDIGKIILFSFLSVLIIGAIPVSLMVLIYQNILLKRNIKNAEKINQNLKKTNFSQTNIINIYSNNKKNMLSIESDKLIAIEANGNYINVYYSENGGSLKRETIRNTLKKTEDSIQTYENFVRCHKSYIVNLSNLKKVSGNAQGYKLEFNYLDFPVPVSRSLSKQILNKVQN